MAEWCQKCGTYHDSTTAGGCPFQEDKLWVGTYAEGFRAGQEAAEARAQALEAECRRLREKAKTAAATAIAQWAARDAMGMRQRTLAETVMAAIDAALPSPEAQGLSR